MKRNVALFGILIVLLAGTYIFQEKRTEKEHNEAHQEDTLVKSEITHLKLPKVEAEKRLGQWWSGTTLMSHNMFKQIETKLSQLKKVKDISGDIKAYFPNPVTFEINHEKWMLGDLSLDKQSFYVAKGDKIYLAYIDGESTHMTHDESEIEGIKLNELVSYISKDFKELVENQLFRFYPSLPMERVVLNVDGSLPFELNFKKNETLPPPIQGVNTHQQLQGKFHSLLTQVTIKEELPYSDKLKYRKLADLTFINDAAQVKWELWLVKEKSADSVIVDPASRRMFQMIGGTLKVFFIGVQDYWDKKVIPQQHFVPFSEMQAKFVQGEKSAVVTIYNKEPFEFDVKGFRIDKLKMEELLQIILNLGPRDQAERVSNLSTSEKKQLMGEEFLRIEIMDQELVIWRKTQEVIVANLTQGFKAHFTMLNENFRGTFQDVLK